MIKNSKSLMDKSRNLAKKYNIATNEVLQNYMFERVLERISVSKYKYNFILKGGLLLSSIMGINIRTTMDMDTSIKGIDLSDEELYVILNEVLNIDVNDNVQFEIKNSEPIREEEQYGGLKYNIIAKFDGIRVNMSIDIATGDLITPKEIEYDYKMIFEDRTLHIMTYNVETIIAEKLQAMVSRGIFNSRMKDYYDLYYLIKHDKFSKQYLKEAILKTFGKRQTNIEDIEIVILNIETSDTIKELWKEYSSKHEYAKNIKFQEIIDKIKTIATELKNEKI